MTNPVTEFIRKGMLRTVVVHCEPHIEELWAMFLLFKVLYLSSFTTKVIIMLTDAGLFTPDGRSVEEWIRKGHLPLGVWGWYLDEHNLSVEEQERGTCVATLLLRAVSYQFTDLENKALERQCAYVAVNDAQGEAKPWELAATVKHLYGHERRSSSDTPLAQLWRVRSFTDRCFNAMVLRDLGRLPVLSHDPESLWHNPGAMVALWTLKRFGHQNPDAARKLDGELFKCDDSGVVRTNGPALDGWKAFERVIGHLNLFDNGFSEYSRMRAFAGEYQGTGQHNTWGFSSLITVLNAYLSGEMSARERWGVLYRYMLWVFDAVHQTDVDYEAAREEVEGFKGTGKGRSKAFTKFKVRGRDGKERLVVGVVSDNPQIVRALRHLLKPTVIVLKTGSGQTTIYGSKHLPMDVIEKKLQELELEVDPSAAKEHRPRWYRFMRSLAHILINGGPSAPGVPRTHIEMHAILMVVCAALREYRGAPRKPSKKKLAAAAEAGPEQIEAIV